MSKKNKPDVLAILDARTTVKTSDIPNTVKEGDHQESDTGKEAVEKGAVDFGYKIGNEGKVSFSNKSVGVEDLQWDFGNGEHSSGDSPETITYSRPGKYTVKATGKSESTGNELVKAKTFSIKDEEERAASGIKSKARRAEIVEGGLTVDDIFDLGPQLRLGRDLSTLEIPKDLADVIDSLCHRASGITKKAIGTLIVQDWVNRNKEGIRKKIMEKAGL